MNRQNNLFPTEKLDMMLSSKFCEIAKIRLRETGECNIVKLPSGSLLYEYDTLEVIVTAWEIITHLEKLRVKITNDSLILPKKLGVNKKKERKVI